MKTRKLNRGLALGGALLVGLAGFVVFDYVNFKSNKQDIQSAVETYLTEAAKASTAQGSARREEWKKALEDNWGYNEFYQNNFMVDYMTASDLKDGIERTNDEELSKGQLSECSVRVKDVKVSKAGPNLAQAEVSYSMSFKGKGQAYLLTLNGLSNTIYDTMNFQETELEYDFDSNVFDGLEYEGSISYDESANFFLEYEGGKWKIVAADGYTNDFFITDEDGNNIDLDRAAKGGSSNEKPDDKKEEEESGGSKVQIKLPDGTVMDLPEGAEIIGGDLVGIDPDKAEKMPEAGIIGDDTSMPEPEMNEPQADSSSQAEEGGADNG